MAPKRSKKSSSKKLPKKLLSKKQRAAVVSPSVSDYESSAVGSPLKPLSPTNQIPENTDFAEHGSSDADRAPLYENSQERDSHRISLSERSTPHGSLESTPHRSVERTSHRSSERTSHRSSERTPSSQSEDRASDDEGLSDDLICTGYIPGGALPAQDDSARTKGKDCIPQDTLAADPAASTPGDHPSRVTRVNALLDTSGPTTHTPQNCDKPALSQPTKKSLQLQLLPAIAVPGDDLQRPTTVYSRLPPANESASRFPALEGDDEENSPLTGELIRSREAAKAKEEAVPSQV